MLVVYTWASQMASCKRIYLPSRRYAFSPWVSKIPWRRKWQHTPVFLPDKSHGQRRLMGYGAWGHKESDNYLATKQWTTYTSVQFSSVTQSCLTLCNPMDCSTPGLPVYHRVYSNSCPLSWWCHLTISFSGVPFFSCLQSFTASGSFQMSKFFTSGGQRIGVSASALVLPMNIQDWFPLGWTGWISLQSKGLSRVFSNTTVQKHQFFSTKLSLESNSHIHTWPLEKL